MPVTLHYQNKATLKRVAANLVAGMSLSNPIFQYVFPIESTDDILLRWYIDENVGGQMALRGAGGAPVKVDPDGRDYWETEPGVFGEYMSIDEIQLLLLGRNVPADQNITVSVKGEVARYQNKLMVRERNRMRVMGWTVARTGEIAIPLPSGGIGYRENYTIATKIAAPLWTDLENGKPLATFQGLQEEYGVGTSNNFGTRAVALMNTFTKNLLTLNQNPKDWGGRKINNGDLMSMADYDIIREAMELPQIIVWDEGWQDDAKVFHKDIPNGEILVVAQRSDGEKPGAFNMTYNAVNNGPGAYAEVIDYSTGERKEIPPRVEVHAGFNGGLVLHRPSQILRLIVA